MHYFQNSNFSKTVVTYGWLLSNVDKLPLRTRFVHTCTFHHWFPFTLPRQKGAFQKGLTIEDL